jgi:phosphoglycolate phosphatase-like HAD superfamily hydrolase
MARISLIVFDLDGVITDERPYWESAREAVGKIVASLIEARSGSGAMSESLPESLIYSLKNKAINSNWDVAYVAVCLALYSSDCDLNLSTLGCPDLQRRQQSVAAFFDATNLTGTDLIKDAGVKLALSLPAEIRHLVEYRGPLWDLCQRRCQEIHDFRMLSGTARHASVLSQERVAEVLCELRDDCNCKLGVATGRPRREAMDALQELGLLAFFDPNRIVTYDDVTDAQRTMRSLGKTYHLGKPHPFILLKAVYPELPVDALLGASRFFENHHWVAFVGDTLSDVLAAKAAGARSLCVDGAVADPGARRERREQLVAAGCDVVLDSIADLPLFIQSEANHASPGQ